MDSLVIPTHSFEVWKIDGVKKTKNGPYLENKTNITELNVESKGNKIFNPHLHMNWWRNWVAFFSSKMLHYFTPEAIASYKWHKCHFHYPMLFMQKGCVEWCWFLFDCYSRGALERVGGGVVWGEEVTSLAIVHLGFLQGLSFSQATPWMGLTCPPDRHQQSRLLHDVLCFWK